MTEKKAPEKFLFVSPRDIVVRTTQGAAIAFEKGKPTHVPQRLHSLVMEKGILPCDAQGKVLDAAEAAEVVPPEKKVKMAPEDPAKLEAELVTAMKMIVERNDAKDFTANGTPHSDAVSGLIGYRVDQKTVRDAWVKLRQAKE